LKAQKLREEATKIERDKHLNSIRSMFSAKQEWRVKEKARTPRLMAFDDDMDLLDDNDMDLLDDDESPLPADMDNNMVFTLPAEFRGAKEEVTQMCLRPKEAVFKKPEESSQHIKPLYI
jgi:hypothetical protein